MLHGSDVRIGDVRFVGGTLWTDYALGAEIQPGRQRDMDIAHSMNACGAMLRDHSAILLDDGAIERFQPEHARAAHQRTRSYLEAVLADFQLPIDLCSNPGAEFDIHQARESSPHDGVPWRRIMATGEIAAHAGDLD